MNSKALLLAIVVLLAAPTGQALQGTFSSTSLQANGAGELAGTFAALTFRGNGTVEAPTLVLDVSGGRVELDRTGRTNSGPIPGSRDQTTATIIEGNFQVAFEEPQNGFRLHGWQTGSGIATIQSPLEIAIPGAESWQQTSATSPDRERAEIDLEGAVRAEQNTESQTRHLTGAFALALHNWNITITTESGEAIQVWTGAESGDTDLSNPTQPIADAVQEAFIFVNQGSLKITGRAAQEELYTRPTTLTGEGTLTLIETRPISGSTESGNLTVDGEFLVDFQTIDSNGITYTLRDEFTPEAVVPPPPTVTQPEPQIVAPEVGAKPLPWGVTGIAFLVLALFGVIVFLGDRYRAERAIQGARDSMQLGVYDLAAKLAGRAQHVRRYRIEAGVIGVTAVLRDAGPEPAQARLKQATRRGLPPGLEDFLHATIYATAGDRDAAAQALSKSIEADDEFQIRAQSSELLQPILYKANQEPMDTSDDSYA